MSSLVASCRLCLLITYKVSFSLSHIKSVNLVWWCLDCKRLFYIILWSLEKGEIFISTTTQKWCSGLLYPPKFLRKISSNVSTTFSKNYNHLKHSLLKKHTFSTFYNLFKHLINNTFSRIQITLNFKRSFILNKIRKKLHTLRCSQFWNKSNYKNLKETTNN